MIHKKNSDWLLPAVLSTKDSPDTQLRLAIAREMSSEISIFRKLEKEMTTNMTRVVVPFVGETHGNAISIVSPQLFNQPVVQLSRPLAFQELNDLLPPCGNSARFLQRESIV